VDTFDKDVKDGKFIEHAVYGGNKYGTSVSAVKAVADVHKICILDVDRRGVQSLKKTKMNPIYLFIKAPSVEILEQRLRARGTETEDSLKKRMEEMKDEMSYAEQEGSYDHVIVNDNLDTAYAQFKSIIEQHYTSIVKK
jgi:guanylate kinase